MRLINVYGHPDATKILYELLQEREPHQSISHKAMPSRVEHCSFVAWRPYQEWYLVEVVTDIVDCVGLVTEIVGAVYLTKKREIGIGILKKYRGNGYGENAVRALMQRHPGRFLANINPKNEPSMALFRKLGFGPEPIQYTYELEIK